MIEYFTGRVAPLTIVWIAVLCTCGCLEIAAQTGVSTQVSTTASPVGPEITSTAQFTALAQKRDTNAHSFHFQFVVTYSDPAWNMFQCQDDSGVVFIPAFPRQAELKAGDYADIEGVTTLRGGLLSLDVKQLKVLKRGAFPKARVVGRNDLMKGGFQGVWIETQGIVRTLRREDRLYFTLLVEGERIQVMVLKSKENDAQKLLDASVKIRGVATGKPHPPGQLEAIAPEIYIEGMDQVEILAPAARDLANIPVIPISTALKSTLKNKDSVERIHLRGAVNKFFEDALFIQDPTGQIKVLTLLAKSFAVDDLIDVKGFLAVRSGELVVQEAIVEKAMPAPANPETPSAAPLTNGIATGYSPTLKTIGEILNLTSAEARKGYPARFAAVATYSDIEWGLVFMEDESGAVCIDNKAKIAIGTGDEVEVQGSTMSGRFQPTVADAVLKVLRPGEIPKPNRVNLSDLLTGAFDCRWVEIEGIARSMTDSWGHVTVNLTTRDGRFEITMPGFTGKPMPTNYIGAKLRIRGACAMKQNPSGQTMGVHLYVPGTNDIVVIEKAAADPFSLPVRHVRDLMRYRPHESMGSQTRVRGEVTYVRPGSAIYLQDHTGGTLAELQAELYGTNHVETGQIVEVVGYPEMGLFSPILQDAIFRVAGTGEGRKPARVTAEQILVGKTNDMELVQIDARLLEDVPQTTLPHLVLQDGSIVFTAGIERIDAKNPMPLWQRGSLLRITGVCAIQPGLSDQPRSFQILLRSSDDVKLLKRPSPLTVKQAITLGAILSMAAAIVLVWVLTLRRQVRQKTDLVRQKLLQEAALEKRYSDLIEEANDVIWTADRAGRLLSVNRAGERMLGYGRQELIGRKITDFAPPDAHPAIETLLKTSLNDDTSQIHALTVVAKDSTRRILEVRSRPMVASGGEPEGLLAIARDVTERHKAAAELARLQRELLDASRMAGMAEVATDILHNVGNVLNSVNVSVTLLHDRHRESSAPGLDKLAALLSEHMAGIDAFLTQDKRGRMIPDYVIQLSQQLRFERETQEKEIAQLRRNVDHIKEIVAMQQNYARVSGFLESVPCAELMDHAVQINATSLERHHIEIRRAYAALPNLTVDKHKLLQILINLIQNAKYALSETPHNDRWIRLGIEPVDRDRVRITVTDNGCGIAPENLAHIFAYGFTTRKDGHGFGLHNGANAAHEMGGSLNVHSDGAGLGAKFTLELPLIGKASDREK
jgi:PAS domain S-box-containing protein